MDSEESRLRTFACWPENAVVDARRIATAGFYYMGQGQEVQCFSCGGRISEWDIGDSVMARHRALDPNCPFVQNPMLSGNIPLINDRKPTNTNQTPKFFHIEGNRLDTFSSWPASSTISPALLVKSGFYYTQVQDQVCCAYCSGVIGRWDPGDDPDYEHRRYFPQCSFMKSKIFDDMNVTFHSNVNFQEAGSDTVDSKVETLKKLGVQDHRIPCHSKYSTYDSRIKSFSHWPPSLAQKPHDLAEAGFYFTGLGDQVRCFHCDGGLRRWEKEDDPWMEHAHWFPQCGFVLLIKGQEYVDEANSIAARLAKTPQLMSPKTRGESPIRRVTSVTEQELQELMNTPDALAALQMGIEASRIKQALKQRIEHTGVTFTTADALVVAALGVQAEQTASADIEDWATPPDSPSLARWRRYNHDVTTVDGGGSSDSDEEVAVLKNENKVDQPKKEESPPVVEKVPSPSKNMPDETSEVNTPMSLEEENRRLREARLCKICMDTEAGVVFLPCRHLITCIHCAPSLSACPLCRQAIRATVRAFLS